MKTIIFLLLTTLGLNLRTPSDLYQSESYLERTNNAFKSTLWTL